MRHKSRSTKNKIWLKNLPTKVRLLMPTIGEKSLGSSIGMADEQFDPTAFDGDMDALVQEGTPWERPATPSAPRGVRKITKPSIMPVEMEYVQPNLTNSSSRSTRGPLSIPDPLPPPSENDAVVDESGFNFVDSLLAIAERTPKKLGLRSQELQTLKKIKDRDQDTELWEVSDFLDNDAIRSELKKHISERIGSKFAERAREDDDFLQSLLLSSIAPTHGLWSLITEALKGDDIEEKRQKLQKLMSGTMDKVTPSQKSFIKESIEWLSDRSKKKSESFDKKIDILAINKAGEYINEWANSSNNSPRSMALQRMAIQEFGLEDGSYYPEDLLPLSGQSLNAQSMKQRTDEEVDMNGMLQREFLRIQYEETQRVLKELNVQSLSVARGMTVGENSQLIKDMNSTNPGWKENNVGVEKPLALRPLSSWATKSWEAMKFAFLYGWSDELQKGNQNVFAVANVPAEQVLSLSTTGMGCLPEWEVVLVAAPINARIFNMPDNVEDAENAEEWLMDPASYEEDSDFGLDSLYDDEDDDFDYED